MSVTLSPTQRRTAFGFLVITTIVALTSLMVWSLWDGGIMAYEWVLLTCFAITLPWTTIGFWNAVIGFMLMRLSKDPATHVFPELAATKDDEPITSSTAIAMCIRNEDVDQVNRNLTAMMARLCASGFGENFHVYVLSDSSEPDIIAEEDKVFSRLKRQWQGRMAVTYRLRTDNWGFKAGNIRDFCERWGDQHDFMLTLDADSVMSASSVLRLVRVLQSNPKVGILQSLVVGLPTDSAFTRVFQFGMRMGMKSYTLGSAWWQADCGPYWGHNALIRIKPFKDDCHLPILPGKGPLSGYVLSHDQVEAVYMRRAGYECRVLAEEGGSYEENPPHILEFIRRDLRWCHGNMQYVKLLREPGLLPTSRIQLILAILMFLSSPAWMTFVVVATSTLVLAPTQFEGFAMGPGYFLFCTIMTMIFAPKLASLADVMLRPKLRKAFGGGLAVLVSAAVEIVFSMLLAPIMAIATTIFLIGLPFGKTQSWTSQNRQAEALPFWTTARRLLPQTLFGLGGLTALIGSSSVTPMGLIVCLPVFLGPLIAAPFGVFTSHMLIGGWAARLGLWQLPEEERPPVIIRALGLPALSHRAMAVSDGAAREPLTTQQLLDMDLELEERLVA